MSPHTQHSAYNAQLLPFHLWLALATLLCLSLTSTIILLLLQSGHPEGLEQANGLHLVIAIGGGMLVSYSLLLLLTRSFYIEQFLPLLRVGGRWVILSIIVGIFFAAFIHYLSRELPGPESPSNTFDVIKQHSRTAEVALIFIVTVFAPIFEEYLFRGLILSSLIARFATFIGIVISAVVFMGFHLLEYYDYWLGLMAIFSLGILLGWFRTSSHSILPSILCHASYNLTIILLA
ncbi:CPBP family intramembrane glutamic endopeptidase [Kangiella sediminilitoris]|uniref:CAAX prenyl protease 2/Lysostaphin resistance protein A-like domain-containing protein n=1 Tax=Kangiella sediminilitoris TaxID=1144748 RepID=A0A1B3BDX4_9GAMM|nr:CPBP family intramembrane glutamic endopeptidase [Kangiella sediminilitoris]AOE51034.1 hypothetical protein KS2013_2330 [Kangiella sediminilitoris]